MQKTLSEMQREEIETIKERSIKINLSDADCVRLAEKCISLDMTISDLLQNFIGDLVDGTYSNGSNERTRANEWVEMCWFSHMENETLLKELYETYSIEWVECFVSMYDEYNNYIANQSDYQDELDNLEQGEKLECVLDYEEHIKDLLEKYTDKDEQIELCRKFISEYIDLKN